MGDVYTNKTYIVNKNYLVATKVAALQIREKLATSCKIKSKMRWDFMAAKRAGGDDMNTIKACLPSSLQRQGVKSSNILI